MRNPPLAAYSGSSPLLQRGVRLLEPFHLQWCIMALHHTKSSWRRLSLLPLFIVCAVITISDCDLAARTQSRANDYIMVIDAGSSGSRLFLYQGSKNIHLPEAQAKVKPGLSSFQDSPTMAAATLKPLFELAAQTLSKLPQPPRNKTPLLIYGTAGMRLLSEQQQRAIYDAISDVSTEYQSLNLTALKTITGQEEAAYAWVAVNQLAHTVKTLGSMELGGASLQVAYELPDSYAPGNYNQDDLITITIDDRQIHLYAKSYLGLGQDQTKASIADTAGCLPQGFTNELEFNASSCQKAISTHIASIVDKQGAMPEPPKDTNFIAFGGFAHLKDFFTIYNSGSLLPTIEGGVCRQSWSNLKAHYDNIPDKYLGYYCMTGVYVSTLFSELFHLASNSQQIDIKKQLAEEKISWTRGAAQSLLLQL